MLNTKNNCFISINSTGINRHKNKIFLINLIFENKKDEIFQIFVDENNPLPSLELFKEKISDYNLITFNGYSFDIPFINEFLLKNKLEIVQNNNFDLYLFLKNFNFFKLDNYKLKNIYESLCKKKFELLDQKFIIKLYKDYLKDNDSLLKDKLLEQGRLSIMSRYEIFESIKSILLNNSINFNIYGLDYSVTAYSYKVTENFINISLYNNLDEFYELSLASDYYKITTKDNYLNLRYEIVKGYINEDTFATCLVFPDYFNLREKYPNLKNNLIPIIINDNLDISILNNIIKYTLTKEII
ncbi:ribonuclease H-like domain-containing protein [Miniphocaeibacter massiliensis]|uniref:ribonuclease H-like domain-containing protein n=1 Tax=Miniphocaeibacter massiliensis TaxID=2041841 RepID=UPI0013EDB068|nr:ribonuclease H-like domain-containing protein [Miniphocaeibacter massiliensis]